MPSFVINPWTQVATSLALLAAAAVLVGSAYRKWRVRAALAEIDTLRFGAYVGLIRRAMGKRGFATEPPRGAIAHNGFEFQAERAGRRYLVSCKEGASTKVTARALLALDQDTLAQSAHGALVFTTGGVEPGARKLAQDLRIELIEGRALWRQVRDAIGDDLNRGIRRRLRAVALRYLRRGVVTGLLVAAAGASAMALSASFVAH